MTVPLSVPVSSFCFPSESEPLSHTRPVCPGQSALSKTPRCSQQPLTRRGQNQELWAEPCTRKALRVMPWILSGRWPWNMQTSLPPSMLSLGFSVWVPVEHCNPVPPHLRAIFWACSLESTHPRPMNCSCVPISSSAALHVVSPQLQRWIWAGYIYCSGLPLYPLLLALRLVAAAVPHPCASARAGHRHAQSLSTPMASPALGRQPPD